MSIFFIKKKDKFFLLFILVFILSEVLIFLSGDRTAFLLINISAIFIILFSNKLIKLRLFTLFSSFILLIIISFINPVAKERILDRTFEQMNLFNSKKINPEEDIYIFSKQHTHHYISAYKMYLDNKIFGVGVKNFRNFCDDPKYKKSELSCSTHPHNTYFQLLAETGTIGFSFLILVLIYFCKYLSKHLSLKFKNKYYFTDFEICLLSGIVIYMWPLTPTGNFFNNWLSICMILNLPFLLRSRKITSIDQFSFFKLKYKNKKSMKVYNAKKKSKKLKIKNQKTQKKRNKLRIR